MTITDQQRKFVWIAAAILAAAYFAPSIITTVWQVTDAQQPRRPSPLRQSPPLSPSPNAAPTFPQVTPYPAAAPAANVAAPASPDEETALSAPATLTGKWAGSVQTDTTICQMNLEVINPADAPGIKGYGSLRCVDLEALAKAQAHRNFTSVLQLVQQSPPTALMLSGKLRRDGAVRFHVDSIIGPAPQAKACTISGIKISQFGTGVAIQWEDGCKGAGAILQRVRS
jgi:hypothetical protein